MSEENLETQVDEQHEEVAESSVDNHGYEKDDIRSVIAAEMDKHESAEAEKADDVSKKDEKVSASEKHDEKGRFTIQEEAQKPVAEAEQQPIEQESKPARNPWASWKKEAQTALSSLPPETQQFIQEREEQFHRGIEQYKQDAFRGRSLGKALAPHMEYLEQVGVQPEQAIATLIQTEKVLRTSDPQTRAQMFMKLAHDYGVDVNSLTNVPFDPYKYQQEQQFNAIQQELMQLKQSRQIAEEAQLGQTIEQFAQQHEYFDEVRETMADLLDKGLASDLNDAYSKAIRLNDDVFTRTTQSVQTNPVQRANNAAKAAKAAAVSVKGSPNGSTRPPEAKSTEDAVRQAMAALGL